MRKVLKDAAECAASLDEARERLEKVKASVTPEGTPEWVVGGANEHFALKSHVSGIGAAVDELENVVRAMLDADVGALEFKRTMAEALEAQAHSIDTIERWIERTSAVGVAWRGKPRFVQLVVPEDAEAPVFQFFALDDEGKVWRKDPSEGWIRMAKDEYAKIGAEWINRDGIAQVSAAPDDGEIENARALVMKAARDLAHRIAVDDRSDEEQERVLWAVNALEVIEKKRTMGGAS